VLNHSFSLDSALPDRSALQPGTRFGRAPALNNRVGLKVKNFSGKPLCSVVIPSTPHPETALPVPYVDAAGFPLWYGLPSRTSFSEAYSSFHTSGHPGHEELATRLSGDYRDRMDRCAKTAEGCQ